ncbi:MAG: metallophosphoesterase [Halobellus sp.]|uniref:metallophosphoesterase n=1 Tax=Halobellus sp. TaxID=1979212 RepID=UPI0035D40571
MDGIEFRTRAAFVEDPATLVVADLHAGRADASGVAFPIGERRDLTERLQSLLDEFEPETVVFAGDVLHQYGTVTKRSRGTVSALADACRTVRATPVFVRGNHDTALDTIGEEVHETFVVSDDPRTVVCHGHETPAIDAERYLVGHDHPAITIEGRKRPCFLDAPDAFQQADVLMLPAFSRVASGVVVNNARGSDLQSPLLTQVGDARPIVYDDGSGEALTFPPLDSFRRLL